MLRHNSGGSRQGSRAGSWMLSGDVTLVLSRRLQFIGAPEPLVSVLLRHCQDGGFPEPHGVGLGGTVWQAG